jgi:hypothetical protein
MSDEEEAEFKRRLDAIQIRAKAQAEVHNKRIEKGRDADESILAEIDATAREWKTRIRPAIARAIKAANGINEDTRISLEVKEGTGLYIAAGKGVQKQLPYADVIASPSPSRSPRRTNKPPNLARSIQERNERLQNAHRLHFAVLKDGLVQMTAHQCDVDPIGPVSRNQLTEQNIRMAIVNLLDGLVPKNEGGNASNFKDR